MADGKHLTKNGNIAFSKYLKNNITTEKAIQFIVDNANIKATKKAEKANEKSKIRHKKITINLIFPVFIIFSPFYLLISQVFRRLLQPNLKSFDSLFRLLLECI